MKGTQESLSTVVMKAESPGGTPTRQTWRTPAQQEPGIDVNRLEPIEGGELGGMNRHFDKETGRMAQIGLTQQVAARQYGTPTSQSGTKGRSEKFLGKNKAPMPQEVAKKEGGQLNPDWVEWLMGWPIGLTDLKPLATDRFRLWLSQHGIC